MSNVAHEILRSHFWRQAAHEVSGPRDTSPFAKTRFVESAGAAYLTRTLVQVEEAGRNVFLDLILPDGGAINVLQVDALARLLSVSLRAFEELLRQCAHVLQIVLYGERHVLFGGDIARLFDYPCCQLCCHAQGPYSAYLLFHGCLVTKTG